jgi:hypothetical protein
MHNSYGELTPSHNLPAGNKAVLGLHIDDSSNEIYSIIFWDVKDSVWRMSDNPEKTSPIDEFPYWQELPEMETKESKRKSNAWKIVYMFIAWVTISTFVFYITGQMPGTLQYNVHRQMHSAWDSADAYRLKGQIQKADSFSDIANHDFNLIYN